MCEFLIGFFIAPMAWLWAVLDAYYSAQLINMERRQSSCDGKGCASFEPDFAMIAGEMGIGSQPGVGSRFFFFAPGPDTTPPPITEGLR